MYTVDAVTVMRKIYKFVPISTAIHTLTNLLYDEFDLYDVNNVRNVLNQLTLLMHNNLYSKDSNGNVKWIKTYGNAGLDYIQDLTIDNSYNLYITGGFQDSINLGGNTIQANSSDIFIAKLDAVGNFIWNTQLSVTGNYKSPNNIFSDADGNFYLAVLS